MFLRFSCQTMTAANARRVIPFSRHQTTVSSASHLNIHNNNKNYVGSVSAAEEPPFGFTLAELESAKPFADIPTPSSVPFFGNLFSFKPFGKLDAFDRVSCCRDMEERFGPISRISLPFIPQFPEWVEILDPADFEIIFRNEGKLPHRPGDPAIARYNEKRRIPLGLFNANQEEWWSMRQPLNKPMMRVNSSIPYLDIQDPIGNELVRVIRSEIRKNEGKFPSIMSTFQKWSLESVCSVIFDRKLGCLDPELAPDSWQRKYIESVTTAVNLTISLGLNPVHKLYHMVGMESKLEKTFDAHMDYVMAKSAELIEDFRRRFEAEPDEDWSKRFLPQLLAVELPIEKKLAMIFDMMLAAIDTTTYALTYNAYYLARNPDAQEALYREIVKHCGDDASNPMALTPSILSKMKYLKGAIKETHRIKPIIPLNVRAVARDVVVKGYRIPKGTNCFVEHEFAAKSDKYFQDPLSYKPERWLREESGSSSSSSSSSDGRGNPFIILPFGFGPRMCIGRRFAEQEIYIGLIKMIQAFQFSYEGPLPLKGFGIDKGPVNLNFVIRER